MTGHDEQDTRALGRRGVRVTRYGLGTAPLGGLFTPVEEADALPIVTAAWEAGLRLFDTAPLYGHGDSERRLGRALRDRPRDSYVLSTKVGRLLRPGVPPDPSQQHAGESIWDGLSQPELNPLFDYSAAGVRQSIEESLERLGLERLDVVHVHDCDDHEEAARDEAIPALCELRDAGRIRAVGVGINQAAMPARLIAATDLDCVLIAGRYSLLDQSALDELLPIALARGVGIIVGGAFNSGVLADPYGARPTFDYRPAPPEVVARAQQLDEVCRRHEVPLKAAALRFPLTHPAVSSVIVGARSIAEVEENRQLMDTPVPDALWDELRERALLRADVPITVADS